MFSLVFFTGRKKRCAEVVLSSDIKSYDGENKVKAKWNGKWCVARVLQEHDDPQWLKSFIVTSDGELLEGNPRGLASTTPVQNSRGSNLIKENFLEYQAGKVIDHHGPTTSDAPNIQTPIIPEETNTGHGGVQDITIDQLTNVVQIENYIEMPTSLPASMQTPVIHEIATSNAPGIQPPTKPDDTNPGHESITITTADQLPNVPDNEEHIEIPKSLSASRGTPIIPTPDYSKGPSQIQENRVISDGFTLATTAELSAAASIQVVDGGNDALDLCIPRTEENISIDKSNTVIDSCTSTMVEFGAPIQLMNPIDLSLPKPQHPTTKIAKFGQNCHSALLKPRKDNDCRIISTFHVGLQGSGNVLGLHTSISPAVEALPSATTNVEVGDCTTGTTSELSEDVCVITDEIKAESNSATDSAASPPKYCRITGTTVAVIHISADDPILADSNHIPIVHPVATNTLHLSMDDDCVIIENPSVESDGARTLQNHRTSEESEIRVLSVAEINGIVDTPLVRDDHDGHDDHDGGSDDEIQIIQEGMNNDQMLAQHALENNEQMRRHNNPDMIQLVPGNNVTINRYDLDTLIRNYGHDSASLGRELFMTLIGRERLLTMTATGRGGFDRIPPRILNAVEDYIISYTNNAVDHPKFRRRVAQLLNGLRKRE